ncbi:tryptophan--tRNA ligase [bacterium DOLJORAL78_65_58]|nr:MAG: tryptophan--tRNA ligase [bacterium DOLZORAL124_64_63]PIE75811.1 MAG: tryptophan--tRNA ligase [bacterium DOLJORAL78_65_58]
MRPTGHLHWGNYTGALENWARLQDEYTCHFMVADWHVLTTALDKADQIRANSRAMYLDWLGAGLDPEKSIIFIQSEVKQHAELNLILGMMISMGRLERNPTFKEQIRDLNMQGEISFGHLGYPVLQAADILVYRAHAVPVGEDQLPHLELTREMARRFNRYFGKVFPEPEPIVTRFSRFPGTDGKRMSKSLGNTIEISAGPEEIRKKIMPCVTDPQRVRRNDPGDPEVCSVYTWYQKFLPAEVEETAAECRTAARGCVDCKKKLAEGVIEHFAPLRERRARYADDPAKLDEIIAAGCERARQVAAATMDQVHDAMGIG